MFPSLVQLCTGISNLPVQSGFSSDLPPLRAGPPLVTPPAHRPPLSASSLPDPLIFSPADSSIKHPTGFDWTSSAWVVSTCGRYLTCQASTEIIIWASDLKPIRRSSVCLDWLHPPTTSQNNINNMYNKELGKENLAPSPPGGDLRNLICHIRSRNASPYGSCNLDKYNWWNWVD